MTIAIVVDDHPMCRSATALALRAVNPGIEVVECASLADARAAAGAAQLMTLDLALPDSRGMAGVGALRDEFPGLRLLVISGSTNPDAERQVAALGARGFVSKEAPLGEMVAAIRAVAADGAWFSDTIAAAAPADSDYDRLDSLTNAQHRVLRAMAGGRLNKQIAHDLGLSEITIKAHVKAILKKLGVVNRTQAVLMLQRCDA